MEKKSPLARTSTLQGTLMDLKSIPPTFVVNVTRYFDCSLSSHDFTTNILKSMEIVVIRDVVHRNHYVRSEESKIC